MYFIFSVFSFYSWPIFIRCSSSEVWTIGLCLGLVHGKWWRHRMETFSALLALCAGNSPVTGEFPAQRPVTRSFDVFFDLRLKNGWVNNRQAGDLRRHRSHYDVIVMSWKIAHTVRLTASLWFILYYNISYWSNLKCQRESNLSIFYLVAGSDQNLDKCMGTQLKYNKTFSLWITLFFFYPKVAIIVCPWTNMGW